MRTANQRQATAGTWPAKPKPEAVRLLLNTRDAAAALAVSERTLWGLTAPRGPIPCIRIGRAVRYRLADLERWAAGEAARPEAGERTDSSGGG